MKRPRLSSRALTGSVVGVVLVYALVGWFVLVSPKRSHAVDLESQISAAETQLGQARAAIRPGTKPARIEVADLFRLSKAMPAATDMPGILLELSRVASDTGIDFESIAPQEAKPAGAYPGLSIRLVFDGNYYELSDFLFRLRNLVGVRNGELDATGRLFTVDRLEFAESENKFPNIQAALTVSAFVYGAAPVAGGAPSAAAPPTAPTAGESPDAPADSNTPVPAAPSSGATAQGVTP